MGEEADGKDGENGSDGDGGQWELTPTTESDWNAVFNLPWLKSMEPEDGNPFEGQIGASIKVKALNITDDTVIMFNDIEIEPDSRNVTDGTFIFTVPEGLSGGRFSVTLRLMGVNSEVFSNTVDFRVLPHLSYISPANGLPGTTITLKGTGFANGAQVVFGDTTFPANYINNTQLEITLPGYEGLSIKPGIKGVKVINPDGKISAEGKPFVFTLDIQVRIKAWRVYPEFVATGSGIVKPDPGPKRTESEIRKIFEEGTTLSKIFKNANIVINLDQEVGQAVVRADWGSKWPGPDGRLDDNIDIITARDDYGNYLHYDEGAINFYFVRDIDEWGTIAYAYQSSLSQINNFAIFQDTIYKDRAIMLDKKKDSYKERMRQVAAQQIGHILGLPHVCHIETYGLQGATTFNRQCSKSEGDHIYLMYPPEFNLSYPHLASDGGLLLTEAEIKIVRKFARLFHNP